MRRWHYVIWNHRTQTNPKQITAKEVTSSRKTMKITPWTLLVDQPDLVVGALNMDRRETTLLIYWKA